MSLDFSINTQEKPMKWFFPSLSGSERGGGESPDSSSDSGSECGGGESPDSRLEADQMR